MFKDNFHLTYCTNIHSGEGWAEVHEKLRHFIPKIKARVVPDRAFGVGLRLSDRASVELLEGNNLNTFKEWLQINDCYVFTINGFPYGGFHDQVVKDQVHQPDWTTTERLDYTLRLFDILVELLPEGIDGGISTSPLSYKYWHMTTQKQDEVRRKSALHLAQVTEYLYRLKAKTGKQLHLDIEPEPDGMIENTQEVIRYFDEYLLPVGLDYLEKKLSISAEEAEECIKSYIQICYDVCHFAVVYEEPEHVFQQLTAKGISVGKIQISAALKMKITDDEEVKKGLAKALKPFAESTYLHQVVERSLNGTLRHYRDLPEALEQLNALNNAEWRTHYHVPVFLTSYGRFESTQKDIVKALQYVLQENLHPHLEVETYTWQVLPDDMQIGMTESITRELQWVKKILETSHESVPMNRG